MDRIARALPVREGKTDALRRYVEELGDRADEERAFHQRFGIRREAVWLQSTPSGDLAILFQEVEDAARARQAIGEIMTSDDPFLVWVRENILDIYDIDMSQGPPPPPPERLVDRTF